MSEENTAERKQKSVPQIKPYTEADKESMKKFIMKPCRLCQAAPDYMYFSVWADLCYTCALSDKIKDSQEALKSPAIDEKVRAYTTELNKHRQELIEVFQTKDKHKIQQKSQDIISFAYGSKTWFECDSCHLQQSIEMCVYVPPENFLCQACVASYLAYSLTCTLVLEGYDDLSKPNTPEIRVIQSRAMTAYRVFHSSILQEIRIFDSCDGSTRCCENCYESFSMKYFKFHKTCCCFCYIPFELQELSDKQQRKRRTLQSRLDRLKKHRDVEKRKARLKLPLNEMDLLILKLANLDYMLDRAKASSLDLQELKCSCGKATADCPRTYSEIKEKVQKYLMELDVEQALNEINTGPKVCDLCSA